MGRLRQIGRNATLSRLLLVVLCVLLVAVAGTVQVAHVHAVGAVTHTDCSLCAAAHVVVEAGHTPAPAPAVRVVRAPEPAPLALIPAAPTTFALFTRPPPVGSVPA